MGTDRLQVVYVSGLRVYILNPMSYHLPTFPGGGGVHSGGSCGPNFIAVALEQPQCTQRFTHAGEHRAPHSVRMLLRPILNP